MGKSGPQGAALALVLLMIDDLADQRPDLFFQNFLRPVRAAVIYNDNLFLLHRSIQNLADDRLDIILFIIAGYHYAERVILPVHGAAPSFSSIRQFPAISHLSGRCSFLPRPQALPPRRLIFRLCSIFLHAAHKIRTALYCSSFQLH